MGVRFHENSETRESENHRFPQRSRLGDFVAPPGSASGASGPTGDLKTFSEDRRRRGSFPTVKIQNIVVETTDAPDDPTHFHTGRDLSVRRVKISATGFGGGLRAAGTTGVAAGTAGSGAARDPSRVREISRLRGDLGAGMATPMAGRTAPLRATLEHAHPAAVSPVRSVRRE